MFCCNCGAQYPDNSHFCPHCGRPIQKIPREIKLPSPAPVTAAPACILTSPAGATPAAAYETFPQRAYGSLKVPAVILIVLSIIGLLLFALIPLGENNTVEAVSGPGLRDSDPDLYFYLLDGSLYFMETLYAGGPELTVPESISGGTVTEIGEGCFSGCKELTTVYLPDSLQMISANGFSDCTALRGLHIPEGVIRIESNAFSGCTALEAITLPSSLRTMEADAFGQCASLKFVFYGGTVAQWEARFSGYFPNEVTVRCSDGSIGNT